MGLSLPSVAAPVANYVPAKRVGDMVYCSGQLPMGTARCCARAGWGRR